MMQMLVTQLRQLWWSPKQLKSQVRLMTMMRNLQESVIKLLLSLLIMLIFLFQTCFPLTFTPLLPDLCWDTPATPAPARTCPAPAPAGTRSSWWASSSLQVAVTNIFVVIQWNIFQGSGVTSENMLSSLTDRNNQSDTFNKFSLLVFQESYQLFTCDNTHT